MYNDNYDAPNPREVVTESGPFLRCHGQDDSVPVQGGTPQSKQDAPSAPLTFSWTVAKEDTSRKIATAAQNPFSEDRSPPLIPVAEISYGSFKSETIECRSADLLSWHAENTVPRHKLDYGDALIAYSKLYALAGYLLLPSLRSSTFGQIRTLFGFMGPLLSRTPMVSNLVSLVKYTYANTASTIFSQDPLRKLITTYIALNYAAFIGEEADSLEAEGGDFVCELRAKIRQQMAFLEENKEKMEVRIEKMKDEKKPKKADRPSPSFLSVNSR